MLNRSEVTRRIRKRYQRRDALNLSAVKREDPDLVDAVYQIQPYLGWKGALHEAGISQERDEARRAPRMLTWAMRQYGNWRAALQAAGVDLSKPVFGEHRFLSPADVKAEIKRLKDAGCDLSHTAVCLLPHGTQLTSAGIRFFGTWEAATAADRMFRFGKNLLNTSKAGETRWQRPAAARHIAGKRFRRRFRREPR